jgi:hypothetical protein
MIQSRKVRIGKVISRKNSRTAIFCCHFPCSCHQPIEISKAIPLESRSHVPNSAKFLCNVISHGGLGLVIHRVIRFQRKEYVDQLTSQKIRNALLSMSCPWIPLAFSGSNKRRGSVAADRIKVPIIAEESKERRGGGVKKSPEDELEKETEASF